LGNKIEFKAYLDTSRFRYLLGSLNDVFDLTIKNKSLLKKTACFFGKDFNLFIDSADGVNEDLQIQEYCGRMLKIVQDYSDKPFLYLKANYSPIYSANIIALAEQHNGKVENCFTWTFRPGYYSYIMPNLNDLRKQVQQSNKDYDFGFMGNLDPYVYPKPNLSNELVSWDDFKNFGIGSPADTGYYKFNPRETLFNQLSNEFSMFRGSDVSFEEYIKESIKWKVCFNSPGYGEFTARAIIHSAIGQPVLFRKNTYDNPISWKKYWPEVDFSASDWKNEVVKILDNYQDWSEKSQYYHDTYLTSENIVQDIHQKTIEFEASL
jgi:hypothetical protein